MFKFDLHCFIINTYVLNCNMRFILYTFSFFQLLTGAFVDEWNGLVRIKKIGFTPTFKFTLFGKKVVFDFKDAVVGSIDVYFSFGGMY